jgi:hypothetical protein
VSRRSGIAAVIAATLVLVLAAGFVYLRGGSTPVSVDAAVKQFRNAPRALSADRASAAVTAKTTLHPTVRTDAHTPSSTVPTSKTQRSGGRPLPAEGVYTYSTTGEDDVDVVSGSKHIYPAQTTITVRHSGCGLVERWDVLKERWDEREECPSSRGEALRRLTSYHEFFRHGDVREFKCSGFSHPAGDGPGTTWTVRCNTANTITVTQLRAVAWEPVVVASVSVRTLHIHASSRVTGDQQGTSERDVWGSSASGLVVRERTRVDSDSVLPVFGKAHYHEQYEIRLTSLTPQR